MAKNLFKSFAGGEITPEMYGRLDLGKFQTGLRVCRNFITLPHGPATRRPGMPYLLEAGDSTRRVRLMPFTFSATQAVMLEFGHLYVRFHTAAGTVLEAAGAVTAVTLANPGVFSQAGHGYSTGDWIYLSNIVGMTPLQGRFVKVVVLGVNTYSVTGLDGAAVNTIGYPAFVSGNAARVYTLASPYTDAQVFGIKIAQDSDVLTLTHDQVPTQELRRSGATSWAFSAVSFAPTLVAPTPVAATPTVAVVGNPTTLHYVATTVASDLITESVASATANATNDLSLAGNFNTVTFPAPAAGQRVYVYKQRGGVFGYIGQSTTGSLVDDNIQPDTTLTPPQVVINTNSGAGDYPRAVTHFQRRRWFAGTANKPQTMWATRNATLSNLTSSIPSRDDDGMEFRIAALQQNAILHLVPLNDLVAFTVSGAFRIFADGGPAIAPSTISIKPTGYGGAADIAPALTDASILFVQATGSRVREMTYNSAGTGALSTIDATVMAPHLFDGHNLVQLAYTHGPDSVLWAVRDDGVLLGMSYVPEQQVFGWHHHDTDGFFESAAVITESGVDNLYVVVRRTVNGRTVRYIERLAQRLFVEQADAFFVDAGATYRGAPATVISGLWHLEGKAVVCLADGAVVEGLVVTNGSVTLPVAASVVHVGLGYVSDLNTLPLAYDAAPASGQGMQKNVSSAYLRVRQSSLVAAGPTVDDLTEYPARLVSDHYDSPPSLVTAEIAMSITPDWNPDGGIWVRQQGPSPLTIVSITLDAATAGG